MTFIGLFRRMYSIIILFHLHQLFFYLLKHIKSLKLVSNQLPVQYERFRIRPIRVLCSI